MKEVALSHRKSVDLALKALLLFSFALGTGLGAQLRIPLPFTPVPITFQTFFVLSSGVVMGSLLGSASQVLYILLGILGFPYFSGWASGWRTLLGPTGGYIIAFALAPLLVGWLTREKTSFWRIMIGMLAGNLLIYALGAGWLAYINAFSLPQALLKGVLPFLPGDALKIVFASLLFYPLHNWTRR